MLSLLESTGHLLGKTDGAFLSATQWAEIRRLCADVSALPVCTALHSSIVCASTTLSVATTSTVHKEEVLHLESGEIKKLLKRHD